MKRLRSPRFICNGSNGGFDEEVRLKFGRNILNHSGTNWVMFSNETEHLFQFDKTNYSNLDSIKVSMSLSTSSSSTQCFGRLYNMTDGVEISNTELSSTNYGEFPDQYIFSPNILNDLPDYPISIALQVRSETEGVFVWGNYPVYLFLYRNHQN